MLTDRQQQLLDFLKEQQRRTGMMPSTREIQEHFGFASQTAAVSHLRALEKKGVIQRLAGKARGVVFPDELDREVIIDIPVYGQIPAGYGEDAEPVSEGTLSVDVRSLGVSGRDRAYALKVRGDSMIGAHILDGDLVVMVPDKNPRNHDIVAALIDDESTLKRYVMDNRRPFLRAENPDYPDLIPARELLIQGVMVGLLRQGTGGW